MASEIRVNKITNRSGLTTTTLLDTGVDVVGLVTASGYNVGTGLTARANYIGLTGDISATGVITATSFVGNVTGNLSGDIVGTRTLGTGVTVTAAGVVSATTYFGSGANLTGISVDSTSIKDSGGNVKVQANNSGATVTGVITAVGGNPNEGSFLKGTAVGVGTTTLAGRNAGVGTAPGTIVFNATSGILQVYVADSDGWQDVSSAGGYGFNATGGTKSTTSRSGYAVHTFTAPGTFTVLSNTVTGGEYLIVAGGGGGGKGSLPGIGNEAGAGGAGGHRSFSGQTFTPGSYSVVVGSGGPGSGTGGDGGTSSVFGNSSTGGGSGAGHNYGGTSGRPGGSGGGGAHPHTSGGSGTGGQGNPGGNGGQSTGGGGGGGGGGGSSGKSTPNNRPGGGNGGSGVVYLSVSITGSNSSSMTLISDTFTANATPSKAIVLFAELPDGTSDFTVSATRDNTTFNSITLTDEGFQAGSSGIKIFTGSTPLTGSASPQVQLRWKIVGSSLTNQNKIHGVALQWA